MKDQQSPERDRPRTSQDEEQIRGVGDQDPDDEFDDTDDLEDDEADEDESGTI